MFYDLIDYLYDNAPVERTKQYVELMELLEDIPYTEHEESLQDILMTADQYPTVNTLSSLDAVLDESARRTLHRYGVIIDEDAAIVSGELLAILNSVYSIYSSMDNSLIPDITSNADNDYSAVIEIISVLGEIDTFRLNELVKEITPDMLDRIKDMGESYDMRVYSKTPKIRIRLKEFEYLHLATLATEFIHNIYSGYEFENSVFSLDKELRAMPDTLLAINLVALFLGSKNEGNIDDTIMRVLNRLTYDLTKQIEILRLCRRALAGDIDIEGGVKTNG